MREFADREGVTPGRVRQWISEGRLAVVGENPYEIPGNAKKPDAQPRGPKGPRKPKKGRSRKSSKKA